MESVLDRRKAPAVREFGDLTLPPMRQLRLRNGLPLNVVSQGSHDVCCVTCVWNGGTAEAGSSTLPNLTLSTMREGTSIHSGGEIAEIIEFNGARMFTTTEAHYSVFKLFTLGSKISEVLPLLPEIMFKPTFPESNFNVLRERAAENAEIMNKKVESIASQAINRLVMGDGHPLAKIDTPDTIRNFSIDDLRRWHDRVFLPVVDATTGESTLTIYAAGRITDDVVEAIDSAFGAVEVAQGPVAKLNLVPFRPGKSHETRISVEGALQSAVRMYIPVIGREHPDYVMLRILTVALGGYFGSRLMSNIREEKGYTYGINAYLLGYPEGAFAGVSSSTDNSTAEPLIEEVKKEMARLSTGDFSEEEIRRVRQNVMSTLASTLDSPFEIMDYYINRKVSHIPEGYFEQQVKAAGEMSAEELARVAALYMKPESLYIAVAGGE